MEILYAPNEVNFKGRKVIFLAGPIRCTYDWQAEVINKLSKEYDTNHIILATPRRETGLVSSKRFNHQIHDVQVNWEIKHLAKAAQHGIITFFLSDQTERDPFQSYARTTRFEFGEWFGELKNRDDVVIIVGYEESFPGAKYILDRCKFYLEANPTKKNQLIVCEEGLDEFIDKIKENI